MVKLLDELSDCSGATNPGKFVDTVTFLSGSNTFYLCETHFLVSYIDNFSVNATVADSFRAASANTYVVL